MAKFTPCADCAEQFAAYRKDREAEYKRGIDAAKRELSEEEEDAIALHRDVYAEKNAHVREAMRYALKTGSWTPPNGSGKPNGHTQEEDAEMPMDAETRKMFDDLSGRVRKAEETNTSLAWNTWFAQGETRLLRAHPDATEEEIDAVMEDIKKTGYQPFRGSFVAHARAMFPNRFQAPISKNGEADVTAEQPAREERQGAVSEQFDRPRASTTPRESRKQEIDESAPIEDQIAQARNLAIADAKRVGAV